LGGGQKCVDPPHARFLTELCEAIKKRFA